MSGDDEGWARAVSSWAQARGDIRALVQIGSRARGGAAADAWSDYDYHLVTTRPGRYRDGEFCRELGDCWARGTQVAFGNALKVTAVFAGALEADFVVLRHLHVLAATLALRWPSTRPLWPAVLRRGVDDLRTVAAPGWRVIKGGSAWERRYSRFTPTAPSRMTEVEFGQLCGAFWTQAVWAAKKAARGEYRAAQRCIHGQLIERCLRMLQEEALLGGRTALPEGRRAELWLTGEELEATAFGTAPARAPLAEALGRAADAFARASGAVAGRNGWTHDGHARIRAWLTRAAEAPGGAAARPGPLERLE
jgi:hypothetical protein